METNTIKIVLVDDHDIFRDGISALLIMEEDIEIIGEASDCNELFELLQNNTPDVILLDINMPCKSGIQIAEEMSTRFPDIHIIMLSTNMDEDSIFYSIQAGVKGYLPKNIRKKELTEAIRQVANGKEYYSDSISTTIFRNYKKFAQAGRKHTIEREIELTEREKEIVKWFAEGLSYKEIGAKLFISPRTVESHKNNIMEKLQFKTTVDMVKYAIKHGLIEL